MKLLLPIVHCLVDQEPTTFHKDDADGMTFSFAVNLSFEARADSHAPKDDTLDEEAAAKQEHDDFLTDVPNVQFHLFSVLESDPAKLEYVGPVDRISGAVPAGTPKDLIGWLDDQKDKSPRGMTRYWSTVDAGWDTEVAIDADSATASHRLRAVQSWNAPVGHRFSLTHILKIPREKIASPPPVVPPPPGPPAPPVPPVHFVVLPYFGDLENPLQPPTLDASHDYPPKTPGDIVNVALDYSYMPHGKLKKVVCRTNLIGGSITKPFDPDAIDEGLTADGYFKVDKDAQDVRRLLVWFEERAASLMAANAALSSRGKDPNNDPAFEELFGIKVVQVEKNHELVDTFYWGSIVWYVVARLISTLDDLVIALLKPVSGGNGKLAFDRNSEGELLAPLVSALLKEFEAIDATFALDRSAFDTRKITAAVRSAIGTASPLIAMTSIPPKGSADVVRALRHVYGIETLKVDLAPRNEREFISAILTRYGDGGGIALPEKLADYAKTIKGKSVQAVSRALLDLEQPLQGEAGAEAAIVKLVETAKTNGGPSVANLIAKAYLAEIKRPGDANLQAAVEASIEPAWTAYRGLLDGAFNGAEAVRRATGSSFIRTLLDYAKPDNITPTPVILTNAAADSALFSRRLLAADAPAKSFDPLISPLVVPEPNILLLIAELEQLPPQEFQLFYSAKVAKIREHLDDAFNDAVAPLKALNDPNARFIPDSMPQPIAIQIAASIDGSKLDQFAKHFNGIAVAIRRKDNGDNSDRWAHANLADLSWGPEPKPQPVLPVEPSRSEAAAIHPMLPATSDGRGAMFIEYQGFPFADPALDERVVDSQAEPRDLRRAFYRHDPHDPVFDKGPHDPPKFAPTSRLAYGRTFETFSFITSNAGTVPLVLQRKDPAAPWMPDAEIAAPEAMPPLLATVDYQRRTAIAQMSVIEEATGQPRRIGASIEGVMPLATDYPRVGLEAKSDAPGVRDIFREADGAGVMVATGNAAWRISDIEFSGTPSTLILRFFDRSAAGPDDAGTAEFVIEEASVPGFTKVKEITVRVAFIETAGPTECRLYVDCGTKTIERKLTDRAAVSGWLRVVLNAAATPATLTFAAPGSQKPDNVSAPLLLLAPDEVNWNKGLAKKVAATVSTPRVGYLDFERWFANAGLRKNMFFKTGDDEATIDRAVSLFEHALIAAYVMRHLDTRLAAFLDRLPDPAVEQVRIELIRHDALIAADTIATGKTAQTHPLQERLSDFGRKFSERVDRMIAELELPKPKPEDPTPWTPRRLRRYVFEPLDELFQFSVSVSSGASLALKDGYDGPQDPDDAYRPRLPIFEASVPTGVTARLSLDALVPSSHFNGPGSHPPVFHGGLKQYALRQVSGSYLAFPAAALRVEVMYHSPALFAVSVKDGKPVKKYNDVAIDLAKRMIAAQGIERTRCFDLMTAPAISPVDQETDSEREVLKRQWRLLGEIDVTTQRWRSTGRPIYHYINPRAFRHSGDAHAPVEHPALRLELKSGNLDLAQFEREAFFNRPDIDAHTVTKCLDPLPARTKLQEHHWDASSATYFRHRFTLRSRYAGALTKRETREIPAWPSGLEPAELPRGWTMRVAMMADLSRMLLTRPQLRALIPLTTAPGGDDIRYPAPPVAAVLQEPPFARGGLADRIASEVKTSFGYGFKDDTKHVEILDSRKEGGPVPQLDYRALAEDAALGLVLRSEGPMGLTFDNINAPAPAYPNSMLSLRPDTLFGSEQLPEEFFVGVAMRRYIDPDWTVSQPEPAVELDGERCWWIEPTESVPVDELLTYSVDGKKQLPPLLRLAKGDKGIDVKASKLAIDGTGATGKDDDPVTILRVDEKHLASLAILHQPIAPGRYSTSIFVRTNSARIERGEANAPLMLASFEWSPPKAQAAGDAPARQPPFVSISAPTALARKTMASAPTFLRWTKTSRDFDFVYIPQLQMNNGVEGWTVDRRHVRDLVAALDTNHYQLTFARSGADGTVWLCPSTFTNPQPLHVHRHLGVITSRFLKELGRPIERFDRTAAFRTTEAVLVSLLEPPDSENIFQPRDHVARVVEFETPAQILCGSQVLVPDKYKTAYFDLLSTGLMKDAATVKLPAASLHFYFRFVGPPAHLRQFSSLVITLGRASATPKAQDGAPLAQPTGNPMTLSFAWKNTATDPIAIGVQISLRQPERLPTQDKPAEVQVLLLRSDGTLHDAKPKVEKPLTLVTPDNIQPGLFLSIEAKPSGGNEFWTDVSLLHSSNIDQHLALDFDWLFTPGGETEPQTSVSPLGLTTMTEAQARVIAVSPPIPIVKH